MSNIELSIIIPTHKRKNLLFFELEHIYNQKDVIFEVIVVNDIEEADDTDEIRNKFPDVFYIKDNSIQGPSNKHKVGYKIANGEYLYMPDDDDYLIDPFFFRKAIDKLNEDRNLAFVSGQCNISMEFFDPNKNYLKSHQTQVRGRILGSEYLQEFQKKLNKPLSTVSTIYRKLAFDATDAINMIEMSDSLMYMQALLWGDAYIMDDIVAVYRIQERSLTTTASFNFMFNVFKQKELIYYKSKNIIKEPKTFWYHQFSLTYHFWPNKKIYDRIKILIWLFPHNHGSIGLFTLVLKDIIKSI